MAKALFILKRREDYDPKTRSNAHAIKVYHHDNGELVHSVSAVAPESEQTYA